MAFQVRSPDIAPEDETLYWTERKPLRMEDFPIASRDSRRPNTLFVLTDDEGQWALGCAGNSEIRTPSSDALASRGVRSDNFFCTSAVGSLARASLLTEQVPSAHSVQHWIRGDYVQGGPDGPAIEWPMRSPGSTVMSSLSVTPPGRPSRVGGRSSWWYRRAAVRLPFTRSSCNALMTVGRGHDWTGRPGRISYRSMGVNEPTCLRGQN
jgi:hypothetical protein